MIPSPPELLKIAEKAIVTAANIHKAADFTQLRIQTKKSPTDIVTAIDQATEHCLVKIIRSARPHDAITGEEGTTIAGDSSFSNSTKSKGGVSNYNETPPLAFVNDFDQQSEHILLSL